MFAAAVWDVAAGVRVVRGGSEYGQGWASDAAVAGIEVDFEEERDRRGLTAGPPWSSERASLTGKEAMAGYCKYDSGAVLDQGAYRDYLNTR